MSGQASTIKKQLTVEAPIERAFRVFTAQMTRWWPKSHHIGKAALACAALGAGLSQPALADAGLGLLVAGFVANAAAMKFFRFRSFQAPIWRRDDEARGDLP